MDVRECREALRQDMLSAHSCGEATILQCFHSWTKIMHQGTTRQPASGPCRITSLLGACACQHGLTEHHKPGLGDHSMDHEAAETDDQQSILSSFTPRQCHVHHVLPLS